MEVEDTRAKHAGIAVRLRVEVEGHESKGRGNSSEDEGGGV